MKKDLIEIFIVKIFSKPKKIYGTNKILCDHIDEIWRNVLADFSDYKISNDKVFRYTIKNIDIFSNYVWAIPLKSKIVRQ